MRQNIWSKSMHWLKLNLLMPLEDDSQEASGTPGVIIISDEEDIWEAVGLETNTIRSNRCRVFRT